jgi:anti-sigma B factor antagonist
MEVRAHPIRFTDTRSCESVTVLASFYSPSVDVRSLVWRATMPIAIQDLEGNVTRVVLSGRIDVAGALEIDMPMNVVAGSRRAVVIDLSAVDFMASMGLRSIVLGAKSIISKRGKVVLFAPQPAVEEVITVSGIDELIAIHHDEAAAFAAVLPTPA